jgi:hypothetical protein
VFADEKDLGAASNHGGPAAPARCRPPLRALMSRVEPALLSLADRAARRLGLGERPLDADELIRQAERRARRNLRDRSFEPALRAFLEAVEGEAALSVFGRVSLRWDVQRLLGGVLRLERAEDENPQILAAPVKEPIFITGLPRSGTTFLQTLLAQDPGNSTPLSWQTMQPYPDGRDRVRDRRVQRAEWELRAFRRISPEVEGLHPLAADTPQECTEITAHVFQSLRFDTTYWIPSYLAWLEKRGHSAAFAFHKRFLQHLQAQAGGSRNWVLKCPDHVFTLDAIREVYPDARFVFVHRHPAAVLASVAKLTEALRAPFTRRLDKPAIGAEVSERWRLGSEKILEADAALPFGRVLHLHYDEVTRQPLAALEKLYRHFERPFDEAARSRIAGFVARRPRGGYEVNRYEPAEFGLDDGMIADRFAPYIRAFADMGPQAATA